MASAIALFVATCSFLVAASLANADRGTHLACAGVPDGTFIRSTKSCSHYYLCQNGAVVFGDKCPGNYLFNDAKQLCDFASTVDCNSCVQYGRPYFADPTSCSRFFQCVNGLRRTYQCRAGESFDEISNRCQKSGTVDCHLNSPDSPTIPMENPSAKQPTEAEWPMPGGQTTRRPPAFGPPWSIPGENNDPPPEPPGLPPPGKTTLRPGGLGTYKPPPTETTTTPRDPFGPPEAISGESS